jgi:hypothetical protein
MTASEHLKRIAEILKSTEKEARRYCEKVWACPQYRATPSKIIVEALERLGPHAPIEEVARVAIEIWTSRRGQRRTNSEKLVNNDLE